MGPNMYLDYFKFSLMYVLENTNKLEAPTIRLDRAIL